MIVITGWFYGSNYNDVIELEFNSVEEAYDYIVWGWENIEFLTKEIIVK